MTRSVLMGLGAGILGVLVVLVGLHVYIDHKNWHQVVNAIAAQQAASAKAKLPMAAPTPDIAK